ncbi:MAG: aldose epimerase family protein [Bacteroidales bacterium]
MNRPKLKLCCRATLMIPMFLSSFLIMACSGNRQAAVNESDPTGFNKLDSLVRPENFIDTVNGKATALFVLKNSQGLVVKLTNYGARLVSVLMPDTAGKYADICLGYNTISAYRKDPMFLGCSVGRYANRIAKGSFTLEGKKYNLFVNDGQNTLHGGKKGFDKVVWDAQQNGNEVVFNYVSADMEEGYPGNLTVSIRYFLTDTNTLGIEYKAVTDKKTYVNLTNHSYFNLNGEGSGDILSHQMQLNASRFLPVDNTLIPTGILQPVENTPMDFRSPTPIGTRINDSFSQLLAGKGYDHCWVIEPGNMAGVPVLTARVTDPASGRGLELWTTEPGVQFYSGNFMNGRVSGKAGKPYLFRHGFALEPQHFPDSPNQPAFPNTLLKPGEEYHQLSIFNFFNKD